MHIDKEQGIVLGVIATLVLAFVVGVWLPDSRKMQVYQERIATAEEQLGPNFHRPTALAEREKRVQLLRARLAASDRTIPEGPELAPLLLSLARTVQDQGVADPQTQTLDVRHHRFYSEMPVELELTGDFASLFRVLQSIETMPRLVRLDALNLRSLREDAGGGTHPRMRASLRLSSFFTPTGEEL
jgi:Tfp pilus assembly protein PilO